MIIRRNEMKNEIREQMRGGNGSTQLTHLVDCEKETNVRLLAEMTLAPGASIGNHSHESEAEYFLILSGSGTVNDNGVDTLVNAGDVVITKDGASHNIANTGNVPLVFHAVIVTY